MHKPATQSKAKPKTQRQSRPSGDHQRAVLEMLAEDHRRVQEMFEEFDSIEDEEARRDLVTTACAELTVHAQLEEELFYPAIREEIDTAQRVDEAQVEHGVLKDLITQLEYTEPDDELYAATFHVLEFFIRKYRCGWAAGGGRGGSGPHRSPCRRHMHMWRACWAL